jgi:predicted RNA-binding Zn-ribbon protein involved in translation (DUF1610 family)
MNWLIDLFPDSLRRVAPLIGLLAFILLVIGWRLFCAVREDRRRCPECHELAIGRRQKPDEPYDEYYCKNPEHRPWPCPKLKDEN